MKTSFLLKNFISQKAYVVCLAICFVVALTTQGHSQWASPGTNTFTHGASGGPEIMGFGAQLELIEFQEAASGSVNGLKFMKQSGVNDITEGYFHYITSSNTFHMSKTGTSAGSKFNVDLDNGNTEVTGILDITGGNTAVEIDGDEAIWYDGNAFSWGFAGTRNRFADPITIGGSIVPPNNTALVTTDGAEIKMVGDNSYIQWHSADPNISGNGVNGFVGVNQFGSLFMESNQGKVILDGETGMEFLIADSGARAMVIDADRNVGIGTNTPAYRLQVAGNADITGELTAASDMRLKEDVSELSNALDKIANLNPVCYKFKTDVYPNMDLPSREKMGFLAQEVEEFLPELVSSGTQVSDINGNTFNSKSVNYIEMIPMLTKAIQEQQAIINAQKSDLTDLKTEMASLKLLMNTMAAAN